VVPKVIAHFLEREPLGHEVSRTGVTKRMWATMSALDFQCTQATAHRVVQRARREWTKGCVQGEKDLAMRTTGPDLLQIANYGLANAPQQGIFLSLTLLGTQDGNDLVLPIHLFQSQTSHFGATKPVHGNQHQDRPITNVSRLLAPGTGDESLHVRPGRSNRERFLREQTRPIDAD
jgi:hypothetical protein